MDSRDEMVAIMANDAMLDTGIYSDAEAVQNGHPMLVTADEDRNDGVKVFGGHKRDTSSDMGGAPGYIDVTVSSVT